MLKKLRNLFTDSRVKMFSFGDHAEYNAELMLWKRLPRLFKARRFVFAWSLLIVLLCIGLVLQMRGLSGYYQYDGPVPGGGFTEGIVGDFTNANPLYATGAIDRSVSKLVFSSLMTYDNQNNLVGDLAGNVDSDERGATWTVTLKPNLFWHDGQPLTASDVVFTYQTIQNPDADSFLHSSWRGVEVRAVDDQTVEFNLPNGLSSFPHNLTNGIIPKHLLENVPATSLRTIQFNTSNPIGSGPFKWEVIEISTSESERRQAQIAFRANDRYHLGRPKLDRFAIKTYPDKDSLISSLEDKSINAAVGLESVPEELQDITAFNINNITQTSAIMIFFNTNDSVLGGVRVRRALVSASDTTAIIAALDAPVRKVDSPFLTDHFAYDKSLVQLSFDQARARELLEEAGWKLNGQNVRRKGEAPLELNLSARDTKINQIITNVLRDQWQDIGVNLKISLLDELEFQSAISSHDYQLLLHGISLGVDPDVFPYWHSTQADIRSNTRLNFSEYASDEADEALEGGRTRTDIELRKAKYQPFLQNWRQDAPAFGLYQPRFLYITNTSLAGFEAVAINNVTDRLNNVHKWMSRVGKVDRINNSNRQE